MADFYSVMADFYSVGARVVGMSGVGLYGTLSGGQVCPRSPVWLTTAGLCRPSRVCVLWGDLLPD